MSMVNKYWQIINVNFTMPQQSLLTEMNNMKIGYARISTLEQNLDLQVDALKKEAVFSMLSPNR